MNYLHLLGTIALQYIKDKPQALTTPGRVGDYLGSGEGTIKGERLNGRLQLLLPLLAPLPKKRAG